MVGPDFHPRMPGLVVVDPEIGIPEGCPFGSLYENEFYALCCGGIKIHHPVVGGDVYPPDRVFCRINVGGRRQEFPVSLDAGEGKQDGNRKKCDAYLQVADTGDDMMECT